MTDPTPQQPELPSQQQPMLSPQQIAEAAAAGANLLERDTTLIPGSIKKQVTVLELILQQIAMGQLAVVSVGEPPVESDSEDDNKQAPD